MVARNEQVDDDWADFASRFAIHLRQLRVEAGLSQEDVAYRSGVSRYTYQRYERGQSAEGTPANPPLRTLLAMAQVLDVGIAQLIPEAIPDLRSR